MASGLTLDVARAVLRLYVMNNNGIKVGDRVRYVDRDGLVQGATALVLAVNDGKALIAIGANVHEIPCQNLEVAN